MATSERTIEIYADTKGIGTCSGERCEEKILWAVVVKSGKKMCFSDPDRLVARSTRHEPSTMRLIEAMPFDQNHWATCPDQKQFR